MINNKRALAIIPARGGSKGLPRKNILPLCGKPLIAWSIEKARKSKFLDVVLVSTDDSEIAEVSRQFGASTPFLRPAHLATDTASSYDVIRHALEYLKSQEKQEFEYTVLLEPTSPLREDDDIDRMLAELEAKSNEYDAIVSLGQVAEHPTIMKRIVDGKMTAYFSDVSHASRRQDNPPAYFPFGVGYIAKTRVLIEENTFYTRRCLPFVINRYQNYEIDDLYDFLCVESVMKHQWRLR